MTQFFCPHVTTRPPQIFRPCDIPEVCMMFRSVSKQPNGTVPINWFVSKVIIQIGAAIEVRPLNSELKFIYFYIAKRDYKNSIIRFLFKFHSVILHKNG